MGSDGDENVVTTNDPDVAAEVQSADLSTAGEDLFKCLHAILDQVEADEGSVELELRGKINELYSETRVVPRATEASIERQLEEISEKMKLVECKIAELAAENPEVVEMLGSTADLWMPVITATADERRRNTST